MKNVLKTLNTIIKTNKSIIKKQNDIECHLNRSVSMAKLSKNDTEHLCPTNGQLYNFTQMNFMIMKYGFVDLPLTVIVFPIPRVNYL